MLASYSDEGGCQKYLPPGRTRQVCLAEAQEGGYGSVSAYFADLLRQRRQTQIDADLKFLADAMKDAPAGPEPIEEIVQACRTARRQMQKERWNP